MHDTKLRLLTAGMQLLLARGYHAVGVQDVLAATGVPKGSFYHHFESKEDFALQALEVYQANVHELLAATLDRPGRPPLARVRDFFEGVRDAYMHEGYLGCFLGALGQELSGASDVFRRRIDGCLDEIAGRIAGCLTEARRAGDLPAAADPARMAELLVNAWEGAALRSRLVRDARPLMDMLDFYFTAVTTR
jgi:TetR/AcrR family transcriptional repressor of nem operon